MQNRIRECRQAAGMSQVELAVKAGVSPDAIIKWEADRRNISCSRAEMLASALHVSPAYLVGWSDNPSEEDPDTFKDYVNNRLEPEPYYDFAKPKPTSGAKVTLDDGRIIYASLEMDDIMNAYILAGDWVCLNGCKIAKSHIVSIEKVGAES